MSPDDGSASATTLRISDEMVRLYKDQFGRGPTRARTYWAGPDTLTVILEETLTPAERNLVKLGEHQRLRDTRMFFQYATVPEFCEPVERLTGRKVRAFLSSIDTMADGLCVETFVLHPAGSDAPSRAALFTAGHDGAGRDGTGGDGPGYEARAAARSPT